MQNTSLISDMELFSPGRQITVICIRRECGIKSATPTLGGDLLRIRIRRWFRERGNFIITGMPEISGAISERTEAGPPRAIRRKKSQKNLRILRMKTK